ncbi:M48 family metallopeptidase [Chitinivorax sp. B]|uniref:M48 family metallopeptidase n=1 Tax=Chitinivorax sp. B TaxID=2502235 RepID=UPI0010F99E0D|nr:M48 family metallopeptidase [Chitinivorax sp. B]
MLHRHTVQGGPHQLVYLQAYPETIQYQAQQLLLQNRLGALVQAKYPEGHPVQTDKALYQYATALKQEHLRNAPPLSKVQYDSKLGLIHHALGLNTAISRVQGGKLKAKSEIRVASLFKMAPAAFLKMIVVHELAHLRERDHNKAFYQLCAHMEPAYHQLELDLRLYLTHLDWSAQQTIST